MGTPKHKFGYEIQDLNGKPVQVVSGKDYPAAMDRALAKIYGMRRSGMHLVPLQNVYNPVNDQWEFEYDHGAKLEDHRAILNGATLPEGACWRSLGPVFVTMISKDTP